MIGEELNLFGSLSDPEGPDQGEEEPLFSEEQLGRPLTRETARASSSAPQETSPEQHYIHTDVEMQNTQADKFSKKAPEAKRTRGGASQKAGYTQASPELAQAMRKRLPSSDEEKEG